MVTLRRMLLIAATAAVMFFAVGMGKQAHAAEYPKVANLKAFSPEANFMSLPGLLRSTPAGS